MPTTLSDARTQTRFWAVFAILGIVLAVVGWLRWAF
jgi:hypothetical protein